MKVVYVMLRAVTGEVYGGEKSTIVTARGAAERGHQPRFLVTADDLLAKEIQAAGLAFDVLPLGDPIAGIRDAPLLEKVRRTWQLARLNARVFRMASGRARAVVHVASMPEFFAAWAGARAARAGLVFHVRDVSRAGHTRWYQEMAMLLTDRTIAISDSLRESLVSTATSALRGVLERRVVTVYNGFQYDVMDEFTARHRREDARAAFGLADDEVVAVMVGAVNEKKGQLKFIEEVLPSIAATCPKLRMVFIGGFIHPDYVARCRAAVAAHALERRVTFAGYCSQPGVYRWYRAADLAVIASAREGLSRFAVEAQAFALPVVSLRIVGPVDVVEHGTTGYLTAVGDPGGMAAAIDRLYHDVELRERLGVRGAARVRERFVLERHKDEIAKIYEEVVR